MLTVLVHFRPIDIPYGDKDQKGDYTLQPGDLVEFNIATDRRDKLQRATNIALVEDTFKVNGEKRETVSTAFVLSDLWGWASLIRLYFGLTSILTGIYEIVTDMQHGAVWNRQC